MDRAEARAIAESVLAKLRPKRWSENRLRVMAMVDDGGRRAWLPFGADLIMAPDGSFVGE